MPDAPVLPSIATPPPIAPRRLHGGRPVLEPDPAHAWERRVTLNPAGAYIPPGDALDRLCRAWALPDADAARLRDAGGACALLYRAQGDTDPARDMAPSSLGLAVLTPDLQLVWRRAEPVIGPDAPFHNLGVEDPRCTRAGDAWHLYYTGYYAPALDAPEDQRRVQICHATTQDFVHWDLHGPARGDLNETNNKNPALLPEPVDGRWVMLHRPMDGPDAMTIHLAEGPSPAGPWRSLGPMLFPRRWREFERSWIGAGGPPLPLGNDCFLMIYHMGHFTPEGAREYDLAAALLDFRQGEPVRARIEPLMRPTGAAEQQGDAALGVDNVLFTCANYALTDRLIIPYAGADSRIFGAEISMPALVAALEARAAGR